MRRIHKYIGVINGYKIWRIANPKMPGFCYDPPAIEADSKFRIKILRLIIILERNGASAEQAKEVLKRINNLTNG